ncbi:MAG: hypothetical protein K1060chlam1_00942 [Candidatus Anoxychlamydiales bacterium]|nr:hypothetical protein [Candidatus Anoxychlamydiales bacterium]
MSPQSGEISLRDHAQGVVTRLREHLEEQSNEAVAEIQALKLTAKKIEAQMQKLQTLSRENQEVVRQFLPNHSSKAAVLERMNQSNLSSLSDSLLAFNQKRK